MADSFLRLHPIDPLAPLPSPDALLAACRERGLAGDAFDFYGSVQYRPGPRFAELVVFERSHEVVLLEPDSSGRLREAGRVDSRSQCALEFTPAAERVQCLMICPPGEDPTCPHCGRPVEDWGEELSAWWEAGDEYRFACAGCGVPRAPWEYDWHFSGGFGRLSFDVRGVRHGEAMPSQELLEALKSLGAGGWTYFYTRT